jgi:hypothetical protein
LSAPLKSVSTFALTASAALSKGLRAEMLVASGDRPGTLGVAEQGGGDGLGVAEDRAEGRVAVAQRVPREVRGRAKTTPRPVERESPARGVGEHKIARMTPALAGNNDVRGLREIARR